MIELLKSLYDQNEQYHEVKERMAWQALAIYLGFSLLFMNWLAANVYSWIAYWWYVYLPVLAATVPAFCFARKQIYLKSLSAKKSEIYQNFMRAHPRPTEEQFSSCVERIQKTTCLQFDRRGRPGWWALISMGSFFILQLLLPCLLVHNWLRDP